VALRGHGRGLEVGHAEVHELRPPVRQHHHVAGLDVAVDDTRAMRVVQRVRQRREDPQRLLDGELAAVAQDRLQRRALQVLHDEEVLAHVEHVHDVGMGQAAGGLGLAPEPAQVLVARVAREILLLDRLDGHHALHERVEAAEDAAHGPVADLLLDLVAAEPARTHVSGAARWRGACTRRRAPARPGARGPTRRDRARRRRGRARDAGPRRRR